MSFLFDKLFNFNNKSGIVNVRMVITEEKILSNIEKVQKMINPKSKKQIVQLEEDTYFKDLVESIKTYLEEYPKKKNFPRSVYKAAYDLVEFATNQFEENTKQIEALIIQREKNIGLAFELKSTLAKIANREEGYEQELETAEVRYSEDIVESLKLIASGNDEEKAAARKLVEARINNLESNFHIEIDMERIEDKSKALSYIGIEIAEALKYIPAPVEEVAKVHVEEEAVTAQAQTQQPVQETKTVQKAKPKLFGKKQQQEPVINAQNMQPEIVKPIKAEKKQPVQNVASQQVNPILEQQPQQFEQEKVQAQKVIQNPQTVAQAKQQQKEDAQVLNDAYMKETRFDAKPSLWQRFKNSKIIRTIRYVMKIRVVLEFPALPEGRGENNF